MLQTLLTQPGLFFHTIILALGTQLRGPPESTISASFALPAVMRRFARRLQMIRVNVKDEVRPKPSLLFHRSRRIPIVSGGKVNVGGNQVLDCSKNCL